MPWRLFKKKEEPPVRDQAAAEPDSWLKTAPGVQVSADDGGVAFLDTTTGRVFVGNRTTALIWSCASKGLSIGGTAEELARLFGIARDHAERDIRVFVEGLQRQGLAEKS